jgi:hypothetical protein
MKYARDVVQWLALDYCLTRRVDDCDFRIRRCSEISGIGINVRAIDPLSIRGQRELALRPASSRLIAWLVFTSRNRQMKHTFPWSGASCTRQSKGKTERPQPAWGEIELVSTILIQRPQRRAPVPPNRGICGTPKKSTTIGIQKPYR